jgi:hypothetical protein
MCGCGTRTPLAANTRDGNVQGLPTRFLVGHRASMRDIRDRIRRLPHPNPTGLCLCGCGHPSTSVETAPLTYRPKLEQERAAEQLEHAIQAHEWLAVLMQESDAIPFSVSPSRFPKAKRPLRRTAPVVVTQLTDLEAA